VRLEELQERLGDRISIEWKSFLLRAEPKTGDRDKFVEYTKSWLNPAEQEPGADFRVWATDAPQPTSSIPAQVAYRILEKEWPELAGAFHDRLLRAYFSENRDISDGNELLALAVGVGADADRFHAASLEFGDETARAVIDEHNSAITNGVTAVPTVVFQDTFPIPGAQPVDTYERIVEKIEANTA
jgi:predicted DsbA family dithiol-disulfide isomerase